MQVFQQSSTETSQGLKCLFAVANRCGGHEELAY